MDVVAQDYTSQLDTLIEQVSAIGDILDTLQIVCGIGGFVAGLILVLIFVCSWRS